MNLSLLGLLRCPAGCEPELKLSAETKSDEDTVTSGALVCPECRREYPIVEGIVRMLPDGLASPNNSNCECSPDEATQRKLSEMQARDQQVDDYDNMWHLRIFGKFLEIPITLRHLSLKRNHTLLEAGCGTGRMTQTFAERCKHVIGLDFSWESLRVSESKRKAAGLKNVDLIQADICHLPVHTNSVDRIVSCGVIEHVPTHDCRLMGIRELTRALRFGENMVMSAYQYSALMRLCSEKEGEHEGGIPFYRFSRKELHELLSTVLSVEAIDPTLIYYWTARCRKEREIPEKRQAHGETLQVVKANS
jgi:ubiquinone/menaquinone biosynthesis C-methylase UbiE/uncharacterized protein YbaR (Trm112 family)